MHTIGTRHAILGHHVHVICTTYNATYGSGTHIIERGYYVAGNVSISWRNHMKDVQCRV